jgi:hypothetical protein
MSEGPQALEFGAGNSTTLQETTMLRNITHGLECTLVNSATDLRVP